MRKITVFENVSLDGYFAGPNGEINWFVGNEETAQYAKEGSSSTNTILFGRVTVRAYGKLLANQRSDKHKLLGEG